MVMGVVEIEDEEEAAAASVPWVVPDLSPSD